MESIRTLLRLTESLIYPLGSHTCSLFAPFHMGSWPKVKLGSHYVPLFGFIYSYFAPNIPFWSRFRLVYLCFPIFSFIYLYLPTFSLICPYLVIFTLNCPNLTIYAIFTLHIYSSSDSEQFSNRFELDLISLLVNFSCELGQIMTRYDFLWARWVIIHD